LFSIKLEIVKIRKIIFLLVIVLPRVARNGSLDFVEGLALCGWGKTKSAIYAVGYDSCEALVAGRFLQRLVRPSSLDFQTHVLINCHLHAHAYPTRMDAFRVAVQQIFGSYIDESM
jgi:hypothetical protein